MKRADDDWEDFRLSNFSDASFGTRRLGRFKIKLSGSRGSFSLIEWASRLQRPQSQNSSEAEAIARGRAAKATLRVKGVFGCVPNEARVVQW